MLAQAASFKLGERRGLNGHASGHHVDMMTFDSLVAEALAWSRTEDPDATEDGARRLVEAILTAETE